MPSWRRENRRARNAFKFKYSCHYNSEECGATVWYFIEEVLKNECCPYSLIKILGFHSESVTDCCGLWLCGRRRVCEVSGVEDRFLDKAVDGWTDRYRRMDGWMGLTAYSTWLCQLIVEAVSHGVTCLKWKHVHTLCDCSHTNQDFSMFSHSMLQIQII